MCDPETKQLLREALFCLNNGHLTVETVPDDRGDLRATGDACAHCGGWPDHAPDCLIVRMRAKIEEAP